MHFPTKALSILIIVFMKILGLIIPIFLLSLVLTLVQSLVYISTFQYAL
jgi:hypothetical protein